MKCSKDFFKLKRKGTNYVVTGETYESINLTDKGKYIANVVDQ